MRSLSAALQTALVQPVVYTIGMVRLDFDSGVVAWHSGFGNIVYNGATYSGVGTLGNITPVKEEPGAKAAGVNITISGIRPEVVSLLLSEPYLGREATVHYALTDADYNFDSNKVVQIFFGKIDDVSCQMGRTASFTIAVRSRLADWERMRKILYNDADQQKLHPGDKGMEYVPQMQQRKLIWPKAAFLPDPRD